jgi:hypothetical protein
MGKPGRRENSEKKGKSKKKNFYHVTFSYDCLLIVSMTISIAINLDFYNC